MKSTTQKRSRGQAALAAFALALVIVTWVSSVPGTNVLPDRASDFLSVLNTEEVAGERVGVWERREAGVTIAVRPVGHNAPGS